jgi:hypothetical protein
MRRRAVKALIAGLLAAAVAGPAAGALAASSQTSVSSRRVSSSSHGLDVLPFPGTPDAAPGSDIYLPAAARSQIVSIHATGSRSGAHTGDLSAQPAGAGSAFTPTRPFVPGETVTVAATLRSDAAGAAAGARHSSTLRWSFGIAYPGSADANSIPPASRRPSTPRGTHTFVTHPSFHPPVVRVGKVPDPAAGDFFFGPLSSGQDGPMIVNPQNHLVYYQPSAPSRGPLVYDVDEQRYDGKPVLTYWEGRVVCPPCAGEGEDPILNGSYQTIHTVTAGDGYQKQGTDLHEFLVTRDGHNEVAYVTIWSPVEANLESVGGPANGTTFDWIVQEIDIATNKVIWEWQSLGHVPLADSYTRYVPGQPYDYFHLNSIQQLPDGHVLISARDTWAVYSIDKKTGKISWELGGKRSSFKMGPGTRFYWQHDARLHRHGVFTVFDDGSTPKEEPQSRALEMHLGDHRATLVHAFTHKPPTLSAAEGSVQILPNRHVFVGWGGKPYFSEYSAGGAQIFGGSFVKPIHSYRAFRDTWIGTPSQPPAIAVRAPSGKDEVYASWNGSTQVRHWRLLAGKSPSTLKKVKQVAWSGFETKIEADAASYFEVQALGARSKVLAHGTSVVVQGP